MIDEDRPTINEFYCQNYIDIKVDYQNSFIKALNAINI